MPESASRNPALFAAPGTRARLELARGVTADVVRGAKVGPVIWCWVPRGAADASLQQALGELRDELHPATLRGAVGFLLDGPLLPMSGESPPHATLLRALCQDAAGIVVLQGPAARDRTFPHAAADLRSPSDRALARQLGMPLLVADALQPALNRTVLPVPLAWLVAGSAGRLHRADVEATRHALECLLTLQGIFAGPLPSRESIVARTLVPVMMTSGGLFEPVIEPGESVQRGAVVAHGGTPGSDTRSALGASVGGILLTVRSGAMGDGRAAVIARAPKSASVLAGSTNEVGWCELVDLPDLGVVDLAAKIDTGARTSALHVQSCHLITRGERGRSLYEIEVPSGRRDGETVIARVEVEEHAVVRDSGGHAERRLVIQTKLRIGDRMRRVRVSLTNRGDMRFPMLVGRTALDDNVRVDPSRSFLTRPRE